MEHRSLADDVRAVIEVAKIVAVLCAVFDIRDMTSAAMGMEGNVAAVYVAGQRAACEQIMPRGDVGLVGVRCYEGTWWRVVELGRGDETRWRAVDELEREDAIAALLLRQASLSLMSAEFPPARSPSR